MMLGACALCELRQLQPRWIQLQHVSCETTTEVVRSDEQQHGGSQKGKPKK